MLSIFDKLDQFVTLSGEFSADSFSMVSVHESRKLVKKPKMFKDCYFEAGASLNSPAFSGSFKSFVGAYTYFGVDGYIKNGFIGRFCSIGRRVTIGAGMHSMNDLSTFPGMSKKDKAEPVIIENDVWIGDGAVVLPGVRVGTGAVVGANAVVTKDVEPFSVVGGVPAKHLKYRLTPEFHSMILGSLWWELPKDVIEGTKGIGLKERINTLSDRVKSETFFYKTYMLEASV